LYLPAQSHHGKHSAQQALPKEKEIEHWVKEKSIEQLTVSLRAKPTEREAGITRITKE
jgi:hypothetical protein